MVTAYRVDAPNFSSQHRSAVTLVRPNAFFEAIVGATASAKKAACAIARRIEGDLIARGWPIGTIYGSEAELADRFGVSRMVLREAVRILESRGTARMRRGPNGGLLVLAPEMAAVLEAIHRYVTSHRGLDLQGSICRQVLNAAHLQTAHPSSGRPIGAGMEDFLAGLTAAVEHYAREGAEGRIAMRATPGARSRAEQVFRLLIKDLGNAKADNRRLGSEMDLCERYGADRSVLRQAVRMLEFEGVAVSTAGRGKGLMTRSPDPTALCQLISCYFAAVGVTPDDAMAVFKRLSIEVVSIAARVATNSDRTRLKRARRWLSERHGTVSADVMQLAEESQFRIVSEPLIDILLRCTKSYPSWSSALRDPDDELLGALYREETLKVIAAILDRNPVAAAAAQAAKVDRLAALI
ncbi:FadR/GntR family transcriptional regulator [Caulobacter segnis]|uniref:FadR/GntR family transcriptional regulator n=1 Tax=Caulobacter segnis TaxID=88688 RepID=UPI0001BC0D6B|nr:GntR family transcriptional regulator [Caulobacter segnis]